MMSVFTVMVVFLSVFEPDFVMCDCKSRHTGMVDVNSIPLRTKALKALEAMKREYGVELNMSRISTANETV